jgi:hypothetical protein
MREAFRVRERRRRRLINALVVGVAAAIAGGLILIAALAGPDEREPQDVADLAGVSGLGGETMPPWPAPADATGRAEAAGLSVGPMGMAEHYHAHLDVLVEGRRVEVPANLGIDPASGAMSGLHTHANDGVIHVEADRAGQPFTLGQLFTEWDVRLTSRQIGGLTAGDGRSLQVYVDGEKVDGDPASIQLRAEQQIAVVYGPTGQKVDVPDSYDFSGEG